MKPFVLLLALAALSLPAGNAPAQAVAAPATDSGDNLTVITSERLTFDYKKKFAFFENNVVVTDPELNMKGDRLTVLFSDDGKVLSIKAEGRVKLTQTDKTAQADAALYDVESGKIVLAGSPQVTRGQDTLTADVITFWRDENRMICQPRARLVIHPERSNFKGNLLGVP